MKEGVKEEDNKELKYHKTQIETIEEIKFKEKDKIVLIT